MNIHETMLFRWVGYEIERAAYAKKPSPRRSPLCLSTDLTSKQVALYIQYLRDALDPKKGLLVSNINNADIIGKVAPIVQPMPCLFFTEQAASDANTHCRLYGRLGFGLSKRFIFNQGGRPVIYTNNRKDPVIAALDLLRRTLKTASPRVQNALETWARFIKGTQMSRTRTLRRHVSNLRIGAGVRRAPARKSRTHNESYPKEKAIRFLSEREWRLLKPSDNSSKWIKNSNKIWFRPEIGKELQVIIVPNNRVLQAAYSSPLIRKGLQGKSGIAAQMISLEALGRV
jgi:hypothetical protein